MSAISPDRRLSFEKFPHEFVDQLSIDADNMRFIAVETGRDMGVNSSLLVRGKYRLTSTGAQQYFDTICKGLGAFAYALLNEQHEEVLAADAVPLVGAIVNKTIRQRENAVLGSRMIVCDSRKQLDGVVSARYASITNKQVYELFLSAAELFSFKAEFFQAALTGRDMTVVLADKSPAATVNGARLHMGACVQNSETAGRAIRATTVLLDSVTGTWSAAPFDRDTRVPHIKSKKLRDKMMQMGDILAERQSDPDEVRSKFKAAMNSRVSPEWDERNVQKFKKKLTAAGEEFAVSARLIDAVVDLLTGQDVRRAPTAWDAYVACLTAAKSREIGRSLPLRQLASRLIFR